MKEVYWKRKHYMINNIRNLHTIHIHIVLGRHDRYRIYIIHCIVIGLNQPMATASFLGRLPPSLLDTEGIQKGIQKGYRRDEGIQKGYRRTDNTMPKKKKKT